MHIIWHWLGYHVDVYEAENRPGGIMTYGIPDYRLPLNIIEREIENIKKTGVNIILNHKVAVDVSFRSCKRTMMRFSLPSAHRKHCSWESPERIWKGSITVWTS